MNPLPVILCGKLPQIATTVIGSLKPEFEVIHVILNSDVGKEEIPRILGGQPPSQIGTPNLGTRNYNKKAVAVITGAGYDDAAIQDMRKACQGKRDVPWLRPDLTKPAPPVGPGYGEALVKRIKVFMKDKAEKGQMEKGGVYFY